jgi:hypothetical protein
MKIQESQIIFEGLIEGRVIPPPQKNKKKKLKLKFLALTLKE